MIKYPSQRVGVFVDVGNMYHSAKNLFGARLNYVALLRAAAAGRELVRAIAYVIRSQAQDEGSFFEALAKTGFEVKMKDLQVFAGGAKKGDWDVGVSIDAIRLSPKLDVVVLVTGDGDYLPLVEYLQNHGLQVEVISFGPSTALSLKELADDFIDLAQEPEKFLMQSRSAEPSN